MNVEIALHRAVQLMPADQDHEGMGNSRELQCVNISG